MVYNSNRGGKYEKGEQLYFEAGEGTDLRGILVKTSPTSFRNYSPLHLYTY